MRNTCGIFDVSHMGQIETSGPQAAQLLQRLLSNDLDALAVGGAQYSVLCGEDGGVLDDLFTYRLDAERYLTVTNAANHERDLAWFAAHARESRRARRGRRDEWAMLAVQGPLAREIVQAISDAPLPPRMAVAYAPPRRRRGTRVRDRLHGRGRGRVALSPRGRSRAVGGDPPPRGAPGGSGGAGHAAPGGLLPPLRQRPERGARADRSRARLVCQGGDGLHRRRRGRGRPRGRPARAPRCVRDRGARDPPPGEPCRRRRGGDQRDALAVSGSRDRHGLRASRARRVAGTRIEIDVRGKMRPAVVKDKPLYRKGA